MPAHSCVTATAMLQGVSTICSWTGLVDWTQQFALYWTHGLRSYATASRKWLFAYL